MKISAFKKGNKYLNAQTAEDMNLVGKTFKIFDVFPEAVNGDDKIVLTLEGLDPAIILNKTNQDTLVAAHGDDTDDWRGKTVSLNIIQVRFKGEYRPSIRIVPCETE